MEVRIGTKSIGLAAKDLVPILLLVLLGVLGYLRSTALDHRLDTLTAQQSQLGERVQGQTATILQAVADQRIFVTEKIQGNRNALEAQTEDIRRMLLVHEFNMGKEPSERYPLELDPQAREKPTR